jgi:resuscitation-promoting factor RpfB
LTTEDSTAAYLHYDERQSARPPRFPRLRKNAHVFLLGLTVIGFGLMGWALFSTFKPIPLVLNDKPLTIFSNQKTVAGVLHDAAIRLAPEDVIFPALDAPIPANQPITIRYAFPLKIEVDGDIIPRRTQSRTIVDAIGEAGIVLKPGDQILVNDRIVDPKAQLVRAETASPFDSPPPLPVEIQRAVPIQVNDNGALTTFYTTAPTLGEALRQAGLIVYLGDYVSPDLGMPVSTGWQVYIRRSTPATIMVDGRTINTRTRGKSVSELLQQEGIELKNLDFSDPKPDKLVSDGLTVTVMRVREDVLTEVESLPFNTVYQADPTMELDERKVTQLGAEGVKKRQIRTRYENGREVRRSLDREWIDAAPITQLISYGTKIVKHDLLLPDGTTVKYWRKITMLATSYSAATSGKSRSNPYYGRTFLGWQAGTGIVAVDPRVINLRSNVFVPGYGFAQAGDTGGGIKGRRIDLGFDEANLTLWFKNVDVYLLDPVPPADQINYVLPDAPRSSSGH